jgi:hypothetical protein
MKGYAYNIFSKLGIDVSNFSTLNFNNSLITNGICLSLGSTNILETGQISPTFRKKFDLDAELLKEIFCV